MGTWQEFVPCNAYVWALIGSLAKAGLIICKWCNAQLSILIYELRNMNFRYYYYHIHTGQRSHPRGAIVGPQPPIVGCRLCSGQSREYQAHRDLYQVPESRAEQPVSRPAAGGWVNAKCLWSGQRKEFFGKLICFFVCFCLSILSLSSKCFDRNYSIHKRTGAVFLKFEKMLVT